jgi:hypothetical protein
MSVGESDESMAIRLQAEEEMLYGSLRNGQVDTEPLVGNRNMGGTTITLINGHGNTV